MAEMSYTWTVRVVRPDDLGPRQGAGLLYQGMRLGNAAVGRRGAGTRCGRSAPRRSAASCRSRIRARRRTGWRISRVRTPTRPSSCAVAGRAGVRSAEGHPQGRTLRHSCGSAGRRVRGVRLVQSGTPRRGSKGRRVLLARTGDHRLRGRLQFLQKLFGWEKREDHDMGPMGVYRLFGRNGRETGGMFNKPAEMAGVPPTGCSM